MAESHASFRQLNQSLEKRPRTRLSTALGQTVKSVVRVGFPFKGLYGVNFPQRPSVGFCCIRRKRESNDRSTRAYYQNCESTDRI
jgi:hypothetical protein